MFVSWFGGAPVAALGFLALTGYAENACDRVGDMKEKNFVGAKVALFVGRRLLIILRDDFEGLLYPGLWDFPGGGRETGETPEQTVLREVREEVGLDVPESALIWKRQYTANYLKGTGQDGDKVWFFVAQVPEAMSQQVVFGDEGQGWALVTLKGVMGMSDVVPSYAVRLQDWLDEANDVANVT